MRLLFFIFHSSFVIHHSSFAQLVPNLGGQRVGISAFTFLKNDISPRSLAMGGANVTTSGDAYSPNTNPALVSEVRENTISVSDLYYGGGLHHGYLTGLVPLGKTSTVYAQVNLLNFGFQKVRTEFQPNGNGDYYGSYSLSAGLGYSRQLSERFSVGVGVKYLHEQLAQYHAGAVAADIGFLYRTDWRNLRFGAALQHFGSNSTLQGDYRAVRYGANSQGGVATEGYPAPTLFKMGAQLDAWKTERHLITVAAQLNHPNDNAENIRLGAEYSLDGMFLVRAGYKLNVASDVGPSGGIGFRYSFAGIRMMLDYGVSPSKTLGLYQSLGLQIALPGRQTSTPETTPAQ